LTSSVADTHHGEVFVDRLHQYMTAIYVDRSGLILLQIALGGQLIAINERNNQQQQSKRS